MMPLCGDMVGVAKGIAGLGALFYVAAKVWQALARAEPIDVYPVTKTVRHRIVYHVFSRICSGNYQCGHVSGRKGMQQHVERADI